MVIPPYIRRGDLIGIVSPSGSFERERLCPGLAYLRDRGYRVRVGSAVYDRDRYLAGKDLARAADLNAMFADPEVRAVFATRGGFGAARVLGFLNYGAIRKYPKPLVGFSDTTALQLGIYGRTGMVSYSGVTLCGDVTASWYAGSNGNISVERAHLGAFRRDGRCHGAAGTNRGREAVGRLSFCDLVARGYWIFAGYRGCFAVS